MLKSIRLAATTASTGPLPLDQPSDDARAAVYQGANTPNHTINPRRPRTSRSNGGSRLRRTRHHAAEFHAQAGPDQVTDADIRARIQEHWDASERGDVELEHAIYAVDGVLDYPQSANASACTAVGSTDPGDFSSPGPFLTLVERWNGSSWSIQRSPSPG
jgi:hypothetical protein